jgi:fructosamine-3-kinase
MKIKIRKTKMNNNDKSRSYKSESTNLDSMQATNTSGVPKKPKVSKRPEFKPKSQIANQKP